MAARNDLTAWTDAELTRLAECAAQGMSAGRVAKVLNAEFHGDKSVRTEAAVSLKRSDLGIKNGPRPKRIVIVPEGEQTIEQTTSSDGVEARSNGARIKSVEDLLRHIEADMTRFEIARSEATKYEVATKDPATGKVRTTELHRVFVQLRPKAGPSVEEQVRAIVDGAYTKRQALPKPIARPIKERDNALLQCVVIADPHVGKYAWRQETGWQDYNVRIASDLLRSSAAELIEDGNHRRVGRRAILLLGDFFHYDTPHGQTTGGTALDRDGRVEKMMNEGARALFDIIEQSASVPTDVVVVPGNHDAVLTLSLRLILAAHFRHDKRVSIDTMGTTRKYFTHGQCLIGLTHGDKARKHLGELMALEAADHWGKSLYREVHTGHLHSMAEVTTLGGVVIRTHPALCPPDGWHSLEGYVGATRGMQSFYYHKDGALVGMTMSNPDMKRGKRNAT
jgi:metallophosphoesterase superfamily enzyme